LLHSFIAITLPPLYVLIGIELVDSVGWAPGCHVRGCDSIPGKTNTQCLETTEEN
jgi:hypothetical protein